MRRGLAHVAARPMAHAKRCAKGAVSRFVRTVGKEGRRLRDELGGRLARLAGGVAAPAERHALGVEHAGEVLAGAAADGHGADGDSLQDGRGPVDDGQGAGMGGVSLGYLASPALERARFVDAATRTGAGSEGAPGPGTQGSELHRDDPVVFGGEVAGGAGEGPVPPAVGDPLVRDAAGVLLTEGEGGEALG